LQEVVVPRKSKETPHLRLRLEPALLARLERAREKTGRTLTGEIAKRLDQSFRREDMQADRQAVATEAAKQAALDAINNMLAKISPDDFAAAQKAMGLPVPKLPPEGAGPPVAESTKPEDKNNG
jgi:hypothetical protein